MPPQLWKIEIRHESLNAYRCIRGRDRAEVEQKAAMQRRAWDARWKQIEEKKRIQDEYQSLVWDRRRQRQIATDLTEQAEKNLQSVQQILVTGLSRDPHVDWVSLEDHAKFATPPPEKPTLHAAPAAPEAAAYAAKLTFLDRLILTLRKRKETLAADALQTATRQWEAHRDAVDAKNRALLSEYAVVLQGWGEKKRAYENRQAETNKKIKGQRDAYLVAIPTAIEDYCDRVLLASLYPDNFPRAAELSYVPDAKRVVVEYDLPSPDQIPRIKEVKYVEGKGFFDKYQSDVFLRKLYDDTLYQIALRSLHELFTADSVGGLESIAFNGWVRAIDKATGQDVYAPILSLHVSKGEFSSIDLTRVEPRSCFKKLKGVSSSKLYDLAPIQPLVQISRDDKRFVSAHDVDTDDTTNLAAMDWEDFEHLIRELFEKEFSQNGGEVHITRASRDAGVDAIAFDPDPIRGGKIVIQAKRYTNTVDLSAVRDLYGTVHNEGATKGILVTTADFGSDAYDFVKGKPLTLLNGSNLLYLLQKHGHRARIDIGEARQILQGQPRQRAH